MMEVPVPEFFNAIPDELGGGMFNSLVRGEVLDKDCVASFVAGPGDSRGIVGDGRVCRRTAGMGNVAPQVAA